MRNPPDWWIALGIIPAGAGWMDDISAREGEGMAGWGVVRIRIFGILGFTGFWAVVGLDPAPGMIYQRERARQWLVGGCCQNQDFRDFRIYRILGCCGAGSGSGDDISAREGEGMAGWGVVRIRIFGILGFTGFWAVVGLDPAPGMIYQRERAREWLVGVLSESGFSGFWDLQDFGLLRGWIRLRG